MATPIPANSAPFSLDEVLQLTGGELARAAARAVVGVTTDSRADVTGKLFVALSGENFDGHRFAASALERGAAALLVERWPESLPRDVAASVVIVPDTLQALGDLARGHRRRWGGSLVAVGGSAGKTTTRSSIEVALRALFGSAVHSSPGNLNNRIGVPMVLLGLLEQHRYAVVEVGTNQRGEVSALGRACEPDCAVLTRVGLEHAAGIGSLDAIEAEEGDLLRALAPNGVAIANGDDERASRQLEQCAAGRRLTYGHAADCSVRVLGRELRPNLTSRVRLRAGDEQLELETTLLGKPGALALAAAWCVARELAAVPAGSAPWQRAFLQAGEPGRLCPVPLQDGTLVLDDSYNSNPASVFSSIDVARELATQRASRLVLVLGEMLELGEHSRHEHEAVGRALSEVAPDFSVFVAGDARFAFEAVQANAFEAAFVASATAAFEVVNHGVQAGDTVLVKASRGVGAERIVQGLINARGRMT